MLQVTSNCVCVEGQLIKGETYYRIFCHLHYYTQIYLSEDQQ